MKYLLLTVLGVFLASPVLANDPNWNKACQSPAQNVSTRANIGGGAMYCYQWDDSVTDANPDFEVTSAQASICLSSDTGGTGTTGVTNVQWCSPDVVPSDDSCHTVTNGSLTDGGCVDVSRGLYRLDITAAGSGEEAVAEVRDTQEYH